MLSVSCVSGQGMDCSQSGQTAYGDGGIGIDHAPKDDLPQ